jgi:hypothetical protein
MLGGIQLTLSKLADPSQTKSQQNLTLESLLNGLEGLAHEPLLEQLRKARDNYLKTCQLIKKRRNKQLAHFDRETLLNEKACPIPGLSRKEIEEALKTLRTFMNSIEAYFLDSTTAYHDAVISWDGDVLASVLKRGLRYEELQRAEIIPWNDLEQSRYFSS